MRSRNLTFGSALGAVLFLSASAAAGHGGAHQHANLKRQQHQHQHRSVARSSMVESGTGMTEAARLERRDKKCQFPSDAGLVAVTPDAENAGWAMSPDQPCKPDSYCPYACPPGQLMAQWDPSATEYSYPKSQNGGLYCNKNGEIEKPFPEKPYCVDGTGSVGCKNKAKGNVAFCQTVLPGNEAMLIPTDVQDWAGLAVPDPSYWASTAAHYYINPPGTSTDEACVWGTNEHPVGNWSPYVAGANTDANGQTFLKVGWNPIYLEPATPFRDEVPTWGVRIECDGDGCNGLPCGIDPAKHKVNECTSSTNPGAGGANFCVVTVPKGTKANVVVFEAGKDDGVGNDGQANDKPSQQDPPPPETTSSWQAPSQPSAETATATPSTETTSSIESALSVRSSDPTETTSSATTTVEAQPTATTMTTATSDTTETTATTEDEDEETTEERSEERSEETTEETTEATTTTTARRVEYSPHIFIENGTSTEALSSGSGSALSSSGTAQQTAGTLSGQEGSSSSSPSSSSQPPPPPSNAAGATFKHAPVLGLSLTTTIFLVVFLGSVM